MLEKVHNVRSLNDIKVPSLDLMGMVVMGLVVVTCASSHTASKDSKDKAKDKATRTSTVQYSTGILEYRFLGSRGTS